MNYVSNPIEESGLEESVGTGCMREALWQPLLPVKNINLLTCVMNHQPPRILHSREVLGTFDGTKVPRTKKLLVYLVHSCVRQCS